MSRYSSPEELKGKPSEEVLKLSYDYTRKVLAKYYSMYSKEQAEDFTQDVMLRVWRSFDTYRGDCVYTTWLHTIIVNHARSLARQQITQSIAEFSIESYLSLEIKFDSQGEGWECSTPNSEGRDILIDPASENMYDEVEFRTSCLPALRKSIGSLSLKQRTVIGLYDIVDLPHGEIADSLGITEDDSKVSLHRAHHKLSQLLPEDTAELFT